LLGRSVRAGRPRGLTGLPDAHSGPAFATLAGLTRYAASDPIDLRLLPTGRDQTVIKPSGPALIQRLVTAFRTNL
jgi:cell division protein FtsA